ncbi:MAG: hypothetical protein ACREF7_01490 [Candidatus Saccharimonadales bacterium]
MAKKQTAKVSVDGSDEEQKLIVRVDKMMATENQDMAPDYEPETKQADLEPEKQSATKPKTKIAVVGVDEDSEIADSLPPLDIFADAPGAPPLKVKTEKSAEPKDEQKETEESVVPPVETEQDNTAWVEQPEDNAPQKVENYDDQLTAKAIEDIVAHESDDEGQSAKDSEEPSEVKVDLSRQTKHTHHIFWTLVAIVCLLAVAMTIFIINPSIHNPLSHLHWSSIRRHL